ncbi:MAG TPA: redoxin domain-containing protein [Kiritimatiellia bacterium]|nr:redoxin domain-containing protein [Kiritimatiellia bacterium]
MNRLLFTLSTFAFAFSTLAYSAPKLAEGRYGHAAALVADSIYVFGGYGASRMAADIERIAPDRTRVESAGRMPTPRYWVSAASDGEHVYLLGGVGTDEAGGRAAGGILERWTPASGEWKTLAPLAEPRSMIGLVWFDGRLYAIGGALEDGIRTGRLDIYDPATDTWTRGADMPTPREVDIAVYAGRLYAAGGYNGEKSLTAFEAYDPAADQWEKLPDLPFALSAHKVAVADHVLYTFGHYHQTDRVTAYDFASKRWAQLDLAYQPARHTAVVFDDREVLVIGGNTNSTAQGRDLVQRFDILQLAIAPRREISATRWAYEDPSRPRAIAPRTDRSRFELTGKPAPEFKLELLDGESFTLSANTGKVVVLDFWATWCGPCVRALPKMQELWEAVQTQDVVVVGISTDNPDKLDAVRQMVERFKLTYPTGVDRSDIDKAYFVSAIPSIVLIDRNGVVQTRHIGFSSGMADTLRAQIDTLLAGGSLAKADPTNEEDTVSACGLRARTPFRMNEKYFETIWETNVNTGARHVYGPFDSPVVVQQSRPLLIWDDGQRIHAVRAATGEPVASMALPEGTASATNASRTPRWIVLQRPGSEPLFVRHETRIERVVDGTNQYNRILGGDLTAFTPDGAVAWTYANTRGYAALWALTPGQGDDLLISSDYNMMSIIDAQGRLRAEQRIEYGHRFFIFDSDGDGETEFHLTGARIGAYRLRPPSAE